MWPYSLTLLCLISVLKVQAGPCQRRNVPGETSYYCVCTATYCDEIDKEPHLLLQRNTFVDYVSAKDGGRLQLNTGRFLPRTSPNGVNSNPIVVIRPNISMKYQEIYGFGGAMTDSAALNIASLNQATQQKLMNQYFGRNGIGYTFIRVPFGGTDFSTRNYSYDDTINDTTLKHFSLQVEDIKYKIPYIKMAQRMSPLPVKLISASWSPPEWMKAPRNGTIGYTRLNRNYYDVYSNYYIKCLDAYKKNGLEFWGISAQNEPFVGVGVFYYFNSMGFTPAEMRDFIGSSFGPTLRAKGYGKVRLMILDDNRTFLPGWADVVMADPNVSKYISGIAIHWYFDFLDPTGGRLRATHNDFPDKFLLYTESSVVPIFDITVPNPKPVRLGNWERAQNYTSNIIKDLNNYVTGWVDWNMVLDTQGGPNWVGNYVDSPIIANNKTNEFYKQPLFYAMAHFAKFVTPGSRRIGYTISNNTLVECVSFLRPDNNVAIVVQNRHDTDVNVVVLVESREKIVIPTKSHSIHSVLYKTSN